MLRCSRHIVPYAVWTLLAYYPARHRDAKGLIFYRCGVFFSTSILWGHWTDLNQTWTYSLMTAIWNIWSNSTGHLPPRAGKGAKKALLGPTLNFDRPYLCNGTGYQQSGKTCQSTGTPLYAPKFDELWSRNGLERLVSFCPPPTFSHWETMPVLWTLYNRQQANFGTCYVVARAYSLDQQNAGRAQASFAMHLV